MAKSDDAIRYDLLMQEALVGVVARVLGDAAREGLPGEHHFYVGFRTDADGVEMPDWLRKQYEREIVIVLQRKFWDLAVDETGFSVTLTFGGAPATLRAPFAAITSFRDPHAQIAFQFDPEARLGEAPAPPDEAPPPDETTEDKPDYHTDDEGVVHVAFGKKK